MSLSRRKLGQWLGPWLGPWQGLWLAWVLVVSAQQASAAPRIISYGPRLAAPGSTVTLNGTGLALVNEVTFNTAVATITSRSATTIQVIVPQNAVNGPIYLRDTQGFTDDTSGRQLPDFLAPPRVTAFQRLTPPAPDPIDAQRAAPGNIVEFLGANFISFNEPTFAAAVRVDFEGVNGLVRVIPNTLGTVILQVTVPNGVVTGPVTITTPAGTVRTATDIYFQPILQRFTSVAAAGKTIELAGISLKGVTTVFFGDIAVTPTTVSHTNLTVRVPPITTPVRLTVSSPGGAFQTATFFSLAPTLDSFTPAGGPAGTVVTLTGSGLAGASRVRFGNLDAPVTTAAATRVTTVVPNTAVTSRITVFTPLGTNQNATNFFLPPQLTAVQPNRARPGTVLQITGVSLNGTTNVYIGGGEAEFTVVSDTVMTATVPELVAAGSAPIRVANPGGTNSAALAFTVLGREPTIDSFTPELGGAGTVVSLVGLNFTGTTGVGFGTNSLAAQFLVKSDTNLTLTVPAGARSGLITVTNSFGIGRSGRVFTVGTNASVSLTLSLNPPSVLAGEPLVLNVEIRNAGPIPAAGTQVRFRLPDGLDYLDSTLISGSISLLADGLLWTAGPVGVNQSLLGFLRLQPRFEGTFPITGVVTNSTSDPNPADNRQELTLTAVRPNLTLRGREGGAIILGWPQRAVDYSLQSALRLGPADWRSATNVPVAIEDEWRVEIPLNGAERWYRLAPR